MNIKVLKNYIRLCRTFNIEATVSGLQGYKSYYYQEIKTEKLLTIRI
ncbi:hypothetical protein KPL28_02860 [Clostridium algidicarnis]|nr:hypothetical protein [Clostridium algidicarnis]MBU3208575.1 hypothetical protein [Clostridium algidicarnis]